MTLCDTTCDASVTEQVYGILTSIGNLGAPVGQGIANQIYAQFTPSLSSSDNYVQDSQQFRETVIRTLSFNVQQLPLSTLLSCAASLRCISARCLSFINATLALSVICLCAMLSLALLLSLLHSLFYVELCGFSVYSDSAVYRWRGRSWCNMALCFSGSSSCGSVRVRKINSMSASAIGHPMIDWG